MRTAAPREGRDDDTLVPGTGTFATALLIAALTAALPPAVQAQGGVPCTAIENDAERLACYDRALRAPAPAAAPAAQSPAQTAAPPPAVTAPAASAPAVPAPATAPAARATTPTAQSASPPSAAAPATETAADGRVGTATIVGVSSPQGRPATFTASDGTTWVQTDSQRVLGLPATPFPAEIKAGSMSSYFLVPEGRGRAIRVRMADR